MFFSVFIYGLIAKVLSIFNVEICLNFFCLHNGIPIDVDMWFFNLRLLLNRIIIGWGTDFNK
jgi:hypothetical protein